MNREQEIELVLQLVSEALHSDAGLDIPQFISRYGHLMPELREAIAERLESRPATQSELTLAPSADVLSTIDHQLAANSEHVPRAPLRYIGEYRLESLLGRGAFGEVWRATQANLNRSVAVKLLLAQHCTTELIQRFRREAEVLAQLKHPHIVTVLEVSADQGRHYIAMELVAGVNLKQVLDRGLPDCRWAAEKMQTLAGAIAHAHAAGVVHRDLKPANLLLSEADELKVTDFGLAKRISSDSELTLDGTVLGTLAYMPPEQALGNSKDVGPVADVYAIGATLYHLLTGRPPFPTRPDLPPAAIFEEIRHVDPISPTQLQPERRIARDLETICLKCLEKEPSRRYATAQSLADDLRRYLAGDPIEARPVSWGERAWMRVKKRPVIASLAAAVLLALLTTAGFAARGLQLSQDVVATKASLASQGSELRKTRVEKADAERKAAESKQQEERASALASAEAERRTLHEYLSDMNEAQELWERGELGRLRDLLAAYEQPGGYDPRGFEWHFFRQQLAAPAPVTFTSQGSLWNRLAFNADSTRLAALDRNGVLVCWDLGTGEECFRLAGPAHSFAFSMNGKYCAVLQSAEQGTFQVLQAATGESIQQFRAGLFTTCFAIHPDKDQLLTGNHAGEIFLHEIPSGKAIVEITAAFKDRAFRRRSLDIEHGAILDIAFGPGGSAFVAGWEDGTVQLWHTETRTINRLVDNPHAGPVVGVALNAQGNLLASQSAGHFDPRREVFVPGEVKVTLLPNGSTLSKLVPHPAKLADDAVLLTEHGSIPFGLFRPAFSTDGEQLFTTGSQALSRWDVRTGERQDEYAGHDGLVFAVALSPSGSLVAGAGHDGTIRVWPSAGTPPYAELATALGGIRSLALSADERHIAAICDRGIELRVPDLRTGLLSPPRRLTDPALWIWDATSGEKRYSEDVEFSNSPLQFNEQGHELWSCGKRYALQEDEIVASEPAPPLPYGTVELAGPNQLFIARYSEFKPAIELVRGGEQEVFSRLEKHVPHAAVVAISPDGKWLATGGPDGLVCLWASADGALRHECRAHSDLITALAFTPDSTHLISGGMDRKLYAWEVENGQRIGAFPGHRREISGIAFTGDGQRFASSSGALRVAQLEQGTAGEVRLWDFASGRLCVELKTDREIYSGVAISSNGRRIFAAANTHETITPGRIVVWQ